MEIDDETMRFSNTAANAVASALQLARLEMPEASEARLILLILGNAAAYCGRLRIDNQDVISIVSALYKQGVEMPAISCPKSKFRH